MKLRNCMVLPGSVALQVMINSVLPLSVPKIEVFLGFDNFLMT